MSCTLSRHSCSLAGAELAEERRKERTKTESMREAAIQELMAGGMDRVEAEIELSRREQNRIRKAREIREAGVQTVRQMAKEAKYGKSHRGN